MTRARQLLAGSSVSVYHAYVATVAVVATGILAAAAAAASLHGETGIFALLAVFTLAGELLPIKVPRRGSFEYVTTSIAYAFALLLLFGLGPAAAAYAAACVIADLPRRKPPSRIVFNAAQCVLVLAAGAAALALTGVSAPVHTVSGNLPGLLAAAACIFVADNVLTGIAVAFLEGGDFLSTLVADPGFYSWTTGSLLALGPIIAEAAQESLLMATLPFVPVFAIYVGGSYAVRNYERALHDDLTGLPNRALLLDELAEETSARGTREQVALAILDVTDFKAVNEALGREHGDHLLRAIAERLRVALASGHVVARLSGDEFAIVWRLSGHSGDCRDLCEQLLHLLESPFDLGGLALEVHASIGVAVSPRDGSTGDELLERAQVALRHAKRDVSPWVRYEPELDASSVDRLMLAGQLRHAIECRELTVHFQPKIALREGAHDCVEALVRWNHPELGTISPGGFIPLAERTGLITALTRFVLDVAAQQCAEWLREGLPVRVAVNLSPQNLLEQDLPAEVAGILRRLSLPASFLQVEVTESRVVHDMQRARRVLRELRALGVSVAIDDFGTGYSSLAQLQALEFDELKIDRSFVMKMDEEQGHAAIVRSTIELARHLGIAVTAEGVETEAVLRTLAELGCDYAQGFFVGHPLAGPACRERLLALRSMADPRNRVFARSERPAPQRPNIWVVHSS